MQSMHLFGRHLCSAEKALLDSASKWHRVYTSNNTLTAVTAAGTNTVLQIAIDVFFSVVQSTNTMH